MPLSTVCVSTIGGRHKAWPSQVSLPTQDDQDFLMMNNSDEICTYRRNNQTVYTTLKKPAYFEYDISDDKPTKKEKKWSFGNLFRRKKKTNDSSSEDETKDKSRRKSDKKKKPITFDHVVITPSKPPETLIITTDRDDSNSALSSQTVSKQSKSSTFESLSKHQSAVQFQQTRSKSKSSLDNLSKKSRKDLAKVRAEARRTSLNRNSSSDEDSQRSNSSQRFRSDESLCKIRDSSRRSRAARTERYLKRHSRDGENPNNYLRISKSDAESTFLRVSDESNRSPSASPQLYKSSFSSLSSQTPSNIGLSTIPPTHTHHGRFRVSNSTSNPSYKPPLSMNEYNNTAREFSAPKGYVISNNQRSISFDADIHRPHEKSEVIYGKLELGKPTTKTFVFMDNTQQWRRHNNVYQPPAPPPRDPKRLHGSLILDSLNHNFDARYYHPNDGSLTQVRRIQSATRPAYKSSSENHIPRDAPVILTQRPSSTTPVTTINRAEMKNRSENYQYLTDKQPRSRKPILIQNEGKKNSEPKDVLKETQPLSVSKDRSSFLEQLQAKKSNRYSRGCSPQMFTCETKVKTEIFLPSCLPNNNPDTENLEPVLNGNCESITQDNMDIVNQNKVKEEETSLTKSANLEEALNELEAIYNSLKLGDENLLEMAEKREKELENNSHYQMYNGTRGAFSDSGFSYEPFDSLDSRRRRRYSRKSLRSDDMVFRKLNKPERSATITDPQSVSSKISYLLTSPAYKDQQFDENCDPNEPDVTLDDVVYRNIKQSVKSNVPEHPPPFGIPLGPITPAANSDYLHAVADGEVVKPSRMPDLVKDDLAFRNLRKDSTKEPALPPVSSEDLKNNNFSCPPSPSKRIDLDELKKKRAVRSKSANIGSLISQEVIDRASRRNARDKNAEYKTLTDIADAMQIARQVLKEKDKQLLEHRTGSLSDTDSFYPKYSRYHRMTKRNFDQKQDSAHPAQSEDDRVINEMLSALSQNVDPEGSQRRVKESTPDPVSSFEDGKLAPLFKTNSFEDVLTALAIEAKEASDKFTQELENLDSKDQMDSPTSCKRLLEAAVELRSSSKSDECEEEVLESKATIVFLTPQERQKESDHDYENLVSEPEVNLEDDSVTKIITKEVEDIKIIGEKENNEINEEFQNEAGEKCVDVVMSNASSCNNSPFGMTPAATSLDSFYPQVHASCSNEMSYSKLEPSHALKSPKLVLESSKLNFCNQETSDGLSERPSSRFQPSTSRNFLDMFNIPNNEKTVCFFDNDPADLAIACSYGIACLYQLAALDLFTILGVILAIISFIAMLFF